jgi:hypothetical protein
LVADADAVDALADLVAGRDEVVVGDAGGVDADVPGVAPVAGPSRAPELDLLVLARAQVVAEEDAQVLGVDGRLVVVGVGQPVDVVVGDDQAEELVVGHRGHEVAVAGVREAEGLALRGHLRGLVE